ncbi:hypothetical protein N657DRAFT_678065 [Parathielavia appendiculata]|uniref:Uncharacterized protein n=1 Tax=Parathielavia appendiculata TaxID=2587402 RepID=A0AAN6U7U5_9PEZI|nr:hypothetical protein N657DRAFT_678065 [Parathielavia appendiculata]
MFEVDWADYDCERVGQRRARKDAERQLREKEDANSGHRPKSTRTSTSSNHKHRSFFGSIGRKKTNDSSTKSKQQEPTTPKSVSNKSDRNLKRDNASVKPTDERSDAQSFVDGKSAADQKDHTWPGSPDRSSKGSILSKMTQLTIPTLELQRGAATSEAATGTRLLQVLDDDGSFVARTVTTTYQEGISKPSPRSRAGVGTKVIASPTTPTTPTLPQTSRPQSSRGIEISASEVIDDWCTALHGPARQLPRPGPSGTVRRGSVLLPPNIHRPIPVTPTRQSTKRTALMPPNPSPIRFLADDPSDWKAPDEWNCTPSTGTPVLRPTTDILDRQDQEGPLHSSTMQAETVRTREATLEGKKDGQGDNRASPDSSTSKTSESGPQASQPKKEGTIRKGDRSMRVAI